MIKGIQKTIISIIAALLLVMPFSYSVAADEVYTYDWSRLTAYSFWSAYGYSIYEPEEYFTDQNGVNLSGYTVDRSKFKENVYRSSDGAYLGSYISSSGTNIYYSGGNCTNGSCYIQLDQVSGSGDISLTIPANSLQLIKSGELYIPWIKASSVNRYSAYSWYNSISINNQQDYHIIFYCNKWISNAPVVYPESGSTYTGVRRAVNEVGNPDSTNHMYLYDVTVRGQSDSWTRVTVDLDMNYSYWIIPVYCGRTNGMSDDVYLSIYGEYRTRIVNDQTGNQLMESGNSSSQSSTNAADQSNQQLNTSVTNLTTIENQYNQDLNTQLNNIDFTDHITTQQGFLTSSQWVITTFNSLIANNPITWLIILVCVFYVFRRFN